MKIQCENPSRVKLRLGSEGNYRAVIFQGEKVAECENNDLYITTDHRLIVHQKAAIRTDFSGVYKVDEEELKDDVYEGLRDTDNSLIGLTEITLDEALTDKDLRL